MGVLHLLIRQRRLRLLLSTLGVAVFIGALAFGLATQSGLGRELEGKLVDWRFEQRGKRAVPDDIVILGIDDASDLELDQRFPYRRDVHADALRALERAGARAVVFDVQFLASSSASDAAADSGDSELIQAIRSSAGRLPVVVATDLAAGAEFDYVPMPFEGVTTGRPEIDADPFAYSRAAAGLASFGYTASDAVHRVVEPRRVVPTAGGELALPALSLAGLAAAERTSTDSYRELPTELHINYYGGAGHFPEHPYWWAARGYDGLAGAVEGKIVLIGATSPALQDLHEVPFDSQSGASGKTRQMAGVEIHANALANMRDGSWLEPAPHWQAVLAAIGLALGVWALLTLATPLVGVSGAIALLAGFVAWNRLEFESGILHNLFGPLASGAATFVAVTVMLAVTALRDRTRVRSLFSRYVSPEVVRRLMEHEERIELGGERREITVLFSDIRGFTTLSEHIDPAVMVEQLNDYFAEMVDVVESSDGMLDKFIGDGLMAIFGAPLDQEDHAQRACAVAVEMLERLVAINRQRAAAGLPELSMGIGIHTGEAVVGNVGSPRHRVDFTAIGDTVNLGARLESATKKLGVPVIVSQVTAAQAVPHHDFRQYGSLVVKGRTQATEVFELVLPDELGAALASARDSSLASLGTEEGQPSEQPLGAAGDWFDVA